MLLWVAPSHLTIRDLLGPLTFLFCFTHFLDFSFLIIFHYHLLSTNSSKNDIEFMIIVVFVGLAFVGQGRVIVTRFLSDSAYCTCSNSRTLLTQPHNSRCIMNVK